MKITWKHDEADFPAEKSLEQKVEIFEEQTLAWQLHIADLAINGGVPSGSTEAIPAIPHSEFAVLHICFSYFELIGSLIAKRGEPRFKCGRKSSPTWPGSLSTRTLS